MKTWQTLWRRTRTKTFYNDSGLAGGTVELVEKAHDLEGSQPMIRRSASRDVQLGVNSDVVEPIEFDRFVKTISELGFPWMEFNRPAP